MTALIIEDPHKAVELQFVMRGPAFEEGLPLPLMIRSLDSVQGIVDRSYLALANRQRMSAHERSLFYLRSQGVARGSLFTELGLVFTAAQPMLPIISSLGPAGVWEHAKQAFEFLKIVFETKKEGTPVTITQSGDGSLVNVNAGSQSFVFNGPVYQIANNSLPYYEYLAKQLDADRVTDIRLGEGQQRDVALGLDDKGIFELPTTVEEKQHGVSCEIFEFDKYDGKGRLSVFDGQSVAAGEHRFSVIGKQDLKEYIEAMLHRQVNVTCLEETVDHPLAGRKVVELHVLKVKNQP